VNEPGRIVRVASRGEGVTVDGRHAAFAAPGDLLRDDGNVEPGPHHAVPPCRHFPRCGGCQLQHLDAQSEAGFISDRITGALAAQCLAAEVRAPILSPPASRRRVGFHAERRGGHVLLGFNEAKSHALIDLAECAVLDPRLFALVAPLRRLLAQLMPKRGRADVHATLVDQGIDLLIAGIDAEGLTAAEAITAFAGANGIARLAVDAGLGPEVRWEPDPVTVTLAGVAVSFPPASFLQATREGEAALGAGVREAIGGAATVADLFAGLGTFALALAPGRRVYAAEGAQAPLLAMKGAAARAGLAVFAEHRDLFRRPLSVAELDRFDAVVLDPPRAGARDQAAALAASRVPAIAYVSCNPSTFARDAKTLSEGGYTLRWVQPVGQFRWSTHVELVAGFARG